MKFRIMPTGYGGKRQACISTRSTNEIGFSLIELMIVLSVSLIAASLVFLNMQSAVRSARLHGSGTDFANLLQQARVRAIKDDKYYSVITVPSGSSPQGSAFIDIAGTGVYAAGDPEMVFGQGVTPVAFGTGPALTNLKSLFLPPGTTAQNSVNTTAPGPTFGPRGLPCAPVTAGGYTTCPYLTPTSFITFIQNQQGGAFEAITVTPAGRIREWAYDGSAWTPLN